MGIVEPGAEERLVKLLEGGPLVSVPAIGKPDLAEVGGRLFGADGRHALERIPAPEPHKLRPDDRQIKRDVVRLAPVLPLETPPVHHRGDDAPRVARRGNAVDLLCAL